MPANTDSAPGSSPQADRDGKRNGSENPDSTGRLDPAASCRPERWCRPSEIVLDAELGCLLPGPTAEEEARIEDELTCEGAREPLWVWPRHGKLILLIGYEWFPALQRRGLPFRAITKELADRQHALLFVIRHHLARRSLTPLAASYLRGCCYAQDKQTHGGDRRNQGADEPSGHGKTAEALAALFAVSPATIRRDGVLAAAVCRIAAVCGQNVKPALLAPSLRMRRQGVLDLAALPEDRQKHLVAHLLNQGRLPHSWRTGGERLTLTVPRQPAQLVAKLVKMLDRPHALAVCLGLARALDVQIPETDERVGGR